MNSEGLPLYRRFANEGCITKYWSKEGKSYSGVRNVSNYTDSAESADFIIITTPGLGGIGEDLLQRCGTVYGGTRFGDFLLTNEGIRSFLRMLNTTSLEDGVEVSFTGFFDKGWIKPFYSTLQYSRFMDRDKGCIAPYMGTVGMCFTEGLAVDKIFSQVEVLLQRGGFKGMVEVKVKIYEDEFMVTDIKPFFTPSLYSYAELLTIPLNDFFFPSTVRDVIAKTNKVAMSAMLTLPMYPYGGPGKFEKPLINLKKAEKHFWLTDPLGEASSILGWSTAWGGDLIEAHRRVYRTIKNIVNIPDVQYREDIGFKKIYAEDFFFILKEWGWIDATIRRKVKESVQSECEGTSSQIQEVREDRELES